LRIPPYTRLAFALALFCIRAGLATREVKGKGKAHQLTLAGFFCFKSAKSIGAIKCLVVLKHTNST
jgi:hypothetical protein